MQSHTHTSHIPSCVCVFLGPFLCQTEELFHTRRCSDSELKQVMLSFAVELGSDGSGLGLWSAVNHVGLFGTGSRSGVCIRSSALLSGSISQTARPHSHQLNKQQIIFCTNIRMPGFIILFAFLSFCITSNISRAFLWRVVSATLCINIKMVILTFISLFTC